MFVWRLSAKQERSEFYYPLIRTQPVNQPTCEIELEQVRGCVQATTATSWHVILILLQLRELLRPLELSRTLKETITPLRHGTVTGLL